MVSNGMFEGRERYVPEKLSLLTTYSDISSDAADNIGKKKRKKVEQEVIISLNAPRAGNVVAFLRGITKKQPSIDEISLSEFSGLIAEYDITDDLEYYADGTIQKDKLYALADQYALSFFEE